MIFWPLVHFGPFWCTSWQPHGPSVLNLYQVIKDMYPMHQELPNATSPTFLAKFAKEIMIWYGPFSWVKVAKSYHHLPVGWGTEWSRFWPIITKLGGWFLEYNSMEIVLKFWCHPTFSYSTPTSTEKNREFFCMMKISRKIIKKIKFGWSKLMSC